MNAKNAQPDKLLIKITTRDASQEYVAEEIKSSQAKTTAGNVKPAQMVMSQIHQELIA